MKKTICTFVLLALCSTLVFAQQQLRGFNERETFTFKLYTGMTWATAASTALDTLVTRLVLTARDDAREANPLMVWWMDSDLKAAVIAGAMVGFVFYAADELWKTNRTMGFVAMTVALLVRGYVIYHNLKLLTEHR